MNLKIHSQILVYLQFFSMAWLLLNGNIFAHTPFLMALQITALVLVAWALLAMRLPNLSIFPEPKESAVFVSSGPYRWLRNPMYFSLLLFYAAQLADQFTLARSLVYGLLVVVLMMKIIREEKLLAEVFEGYNDYLKRTWRIIPFVF